jgi:hypothetical protein
MASKRANSKVAASIDDAAKVALLVEKKGKAPIAGAIPQEAFDDEAVNNKRQRQDNLPTRRAPRAPAALRGYLRHPCQASST